MGNTMSGMSILTAGLPCAPLPPHAVLRPGTVDIIVCRNDAQIEGQAIPPGLWLSAEEQRRYGRIVHLVTRRRRLAARSLLRAILGCYCALSPAQLRFAYGLRGKPRLFTGSGGTNGASGGGTVWPYFNVSHSDDWMLCALSAEQELGVDLEQVRPVRDIATLAGLACTTSEQRRLMALPTERRLAALFACWTRKEALIKLYGGAILPLAGDCPVSISTRCERRRYRPPAILTALVNRGEQLMIHDLPVLAGFRATLCYPLGDRSTALKVRMWSFPPIR